MVNLVPCEVTLLIGCPLERRGIGCLGLKDIRDEENTTSENESPKYGRSNGSIRIGGTWETSFNGRRPRSHSFPFLR